MCRARGVGMTFHQGTLDVKDKQEVLERDSMQTGAVQCAIERGRHEVLEDTRYLQ